VLSQSRIAPKSDQEAGGHAGSRPEYGNAVWFGEKRKAQLRREEIGDADRKGEPDRTNARQRRVGAGFVMNFLRYFL